jgi:hypothetical protein
MPDLSRWLFRQIGNLLAIFAVLCSAVLGELVPGLAVFSRLPGIAEIADWPPVLRVMIALIAGGLLFGVLERLLRLQATWEFGTIAWLWRSLKGVVYSVIAVGLAASVAQLLGSVLTEDAIIPETWILVFCLVIIFLGIMPAIMFIKGLDQTGVDQSVEEFSPDNPLPAAQQPDILIMAMSRDSRYPDALVRGKGYDAILREIEARHGETPVDHPITALLEAAETQPELTKHSWFQTARSLDRHFHAQSPREVRDRRILIIVSKPTEKKDRDIDLEGSDTRIGFREFVERLVRLRFGDSASVDITSKPVDIFHYSEVEAQVRELINANIRYGRFRRIRRISVDVTSGPKPYSLAAGAATLDAPATVSYVSTQAPYNLLYRVLQPRR